MATTKKKTTKNDNIYYVTATDKFGTHLLKMSGQNKNMTDKVVVICPSYDEAVRVEGILLFQRKGFTYVNVTSKLPKYSPSKYKVTYYESKQWR